MMPSVDGIFRNGKIELLETPSQQEGTRVVVTFLTPLGRVDLREHGIDEAAAADFRARVGAIAEDWDDPAMDVYNEM